MDSVTIIFIYKSESINIQCKRGEYMKNIFQRFQIKLNKNFENVYYLYNASFVDPELRLEQINAKDNELKILVQSPDDDISKEDQIEYSKEIICPSCGEICLFNINNFKIILNNCKNDHEIEDILFDEFKDTQKIDESKIICEDCKDVNKYTSTDHKFYKCYTCKKNICLLCQNIRHNEHIAIDYDLKDYYCNFHGEKYIYYCQKCNLNLCDLCQHDEKHKLITLKTLIIGQDELFETNIKLKNQIEYLKDEINNIIERLNKVSDYLNMYSNIANEAINNYNIKYKNYQVLTNINNIYKFNNNLINEIDKIINENLIEKKVKYINDIYSRININQMTIEYKIDPKNDIIKLFHEEFVENNKSNYEMIIKFFLYIHNLKN